MLQKSHPQTAPVLRLFEPNRAGYKIVEIEGGKLTLLEQTYSEKGEGGGGGGGGGGIYNLARWVNIK